MIRFLFALKVFFASYYLWGASMVLEEPRGGNWAWYSWDAWFADSGDPKEDYPTSDDDVFLPPNNENSNFFVSLKLPTGLPHKLIKINSLSAEILESESLLSDHTVEDFVIVKDFKKTAAVFEKDGAKLAKGQGHLMIGPGNLKSFLRLKIGGDALISDEAADRTSNMCFGGSAYFGKFNLDNLLASFEVSGDMRIRNTCVYIGTENGVNASVKGSVIFESPVNGRHGVLIVNGDTGDEAFQLLQTVRVGGLTSASAGSGIITTKTLSQRKATNEEAKSSSSSFQSDNKIREGNVEIFGSGGVFTGEIRDNLDSSNTRGRMNVTMNSASGGTQILGGKNKYTGVTYVMNGTLIVRPSADIYLDIQGGIFGYIGTSLTLKGLDFRGGRIAFNLDENRGAEIAGKVAVAEGLGPEDLFEFSAIKERIAYPLFTFKPLPEAFEIFRNATCEYSDAGTGENFTAHFGLSDSALTVLFIKN